MRECFPRASLLSLRRPASRRLPLRARAPYGPTRRRRPPYRRPARRAAGMSNCEHCWLVTCRHSRDATREDTNRRDRRGAFYHNENSPHNKSRQAWRGVAVADPLVAELRQRGLRLHAHCTRPKILYSNYSDCSK